MIERLDISSLKNAVMKLEEGIAISKAEPTKEIVRDGVIHALNIAMNLHRK